MMKKWEYKVIQSTYQKVLSIDNINKLGSKGWEMCGTTSSNISIDNGASVVQLQVIYFKRKVVGDP